jgi:hypothetical protein
MVQCSVVGRHQHFKEIDYLYFKSRRLQSWELGQNVTKNEGTHLSNFMVS